MNNNNFIAIIINISNDGNDDNNKNTNEYWLESTWLFNYFTHKQSTKYAAYK